MNKELRKTNRKLASVQRVNEITPAKGLDKLELVSVVGWNSLAPKGMYKVGDKVVYFEPDSLLANNYGVPLKEDKNTGLYRVRSQKIRGNYSQGLILPLDVVGIDPETPFNTNVTEELGVIKYISIEDTISNVISGGPIGAYQTRFAPKTDAIRIQNLANHYDEIKSLEWDVSVKCDGTSRTIVNDGGEIRYFSRNNEIAPNDGLKAVAPVDELIKLGDGWAIQFELLGPRIQSNRLALAEPLGLVFAVWNHRKNLDRADWPELPHTVREVTDWVFPDTYEEAIEKVNGLTGSYTDGRLDEGLVFCLKQGQEVPEWLDETRRFKIINMEFAAMIDRR